MKVLSKVLMSLMFFLLLTGPVPVAAEEKWDQLSMVDRTLIDRVLQHWSGWVPVRKEDGTAPLITFEELYEGLGAREAGLLEKIRTMDPRESFGFQGLYLGSSRESVRLRRIEGQVYRQEGMERIIPPQYLPERTYAAYLRMMKAMKKDLGRQLLIESGYRSPAYQLYTFVFFLPSHGYSLAETGKWVALPGYSEHGAPQRQAIDFINEDGVNGEVNPAEFEALPEYRWLEHHAGEYGFVLSYPRTQAEGIVFEPWHWSHRMDATAPELV